MKCPKCEHDALIAVSNGIVKCEKCGSRFNISEIQEKDQASIKKLLLG